jgi:glycosyltransferase involved in cell wall biosynthesis
MRVKILDAWRWGLPVISTRVGAEGISYQDGENILIVDTAEEFAEAIVRVMTDVNLARRLRDNGRAWVCEQYEWTKVYSAWDKVYQVR